MVDRPAPRRKPLNAGEVMIGRLNVQEVLCGARSSGGVTRRPSPASTPAHRRARHAVVTSPVGLGTIPLHHTLVDPSAPGAGRGAT